MTSILSSSLLAATMVVGQSTSEPPLATKQAPLGSIVQVAPVTQPSRPIRGWIRGDDRPVLGRIQSWWKREPRETMPNFMPLKEDIRTTPALPTSRPKETAPAIEYPRKLPNSQSQGIKPAAPMANDSTPGKLPIAQSQGVKPVAPVASESTPGKLELEQTTLQNVPSTKATKYPIHPQLTNKIGRDEKFEWITGQLEIENGNHVLYYGTPETVDKFNGRIILQVQQVEMNQFKKGDLISVRGTVTQRQTMQGPVPLYRISHAALIERPKS